MENERIEIYNFGPIKEACFDIKKLNIIIGEQASGKSYINKLIYFFRMLPDELYKVSYEYIKAPHLFFTTVARHSNNDLSVAFKNFSDQYFSLIFKELRFSEIERVTYKKENFIIEINELGIKLFNFEEFIKTIKDLPYKTFDKNEDGQLMSRNRNMFDNYLRRKALQKIIFQFFKNDSEPTYIPAGRMNYINKGNESKSIYEFQYKKKDIISEKYEDLIDYHNTNIADKSLIISKKHKTKLIRDFEKIAFKILKADYLVESGRQLLKVNDQKVLSLSEGSSGQQETAHMLLILQEFVYTKGNYSLFIEEPEAHIYPTAQYDIVKLFSIYLNNSMNNSLFITTHSPYILGSFNNLIYAYFVGSSGYNKKDIEKIIPKCLWINPEDVNAFKIIKGKLKCIIEKKTGMIDNIQIDEASKQINSDYDRIFEYE